MIDSEIRKIDPKVLWPHAWISSHKLPPERQYQADPWVYVEYRTPDGVEGRLAFAGNDYLWWPLSDGKRFGEHMSALLPSKTVLVVKDKYRRRNVADFVVGVDERLRWRY
jgi:hypothetical protein